MALLDWVVPVGCAAGLGFMTHALLRGSLGSPRHLDAVRPVTFILDLTDVSDEQRPFAEKRTSDYHVAEYGLGELV